MSKNKELDVKTYLEQNMDFTTVGCNSKGQSISYKMIHTDGITLQYELCGDGSYQFTVEDETRRLPAPDELTKLLGHEPTSLDIVRLAGQIVGKMLDRYSQDDHTTIQKQFRHYGSR